MTGKPETTGRYRDTHGFSYNRLLNGKLNYNAAAGGDPADPVISGKRNATLYRFPPKTPSGAEVEFWVLEGRTAHLAWRPGRKGRETAGSWTH